MHVFKTIITIFCFFALFFFWRDAGATTVMALSLEGLTLGADAVVMGTATDVRTHRDSSGRIVRSVSYRVDEYVVGGGPNQVFIRLQGGVLDGVGRRVPGEIELPAGEPTLLFLEQVPSEDETFFVAGVAQGRFDVMRDEQTGERFVARTLGSINLVGDVDSDSLLVARPHTSTFVSLETFRAAIFRIANP